MNRAGAEHEPLELERLSPAERRVLEHVLAGRSARQIADLLVLSEATVRSHLSRIYGKLDVSGQVELLARAAAAPSPGLTVAEAASEAASAVDREPTTPRASVPGPVLIMLVGLMVLSVIPPVAIVVGPGLLVAGWLAGRAADTSVMRAARPWLFAAGIVVTVWAVVVLLILGGLFAAGGGTRTDSSWVGT